MYIACLVVFAVLSNGSKLLKGVSIGCRSQMYGSRGMSPAADNVLILKVCNLIEYYIISYMNKLQFQAIYSVTNVSDAFSNFKDM